MKRIVSIILTIILVLGLAGCGQNAAAAWQEQYDLGVKYLSEGNYEEAVIAFTAAIEIDPKRYEAYEGRGDAYWAQEDAASAQVDYAAALELVEQAAATLYGKLADAWIALGDRAQAMAVLQQGLDALGQDETLLSKVEELGFLLGEDGVLTDFLADLDLDEYYHSIVFDQFDGRYPQATTWPEPEYLITDAQKEEVYRPLIQRIELAESLDTEDPDRWLKLLEGMYYVLGDMDQVLAIRTELYQRKLAEGDDYAEWYNPDGYVESSGEDENIYDGWGRYLEFRSHGLANSQLYEYDEKGRPIRNTSTSTTVEHVVTWEFTYGADGRLSRMDMTDTQPAGITTESHEFFYEGNTVRRHVIIYDHHFDMVEADYWETAVIDSYGYLVSDWTTD